MATERAMTHRFSRLAQVVLALSAMFLIGAVAQASAATWKIQSTPSPGGSNYGLSDVSCISSSECIAVGFKSPSAAMAERWDGSEWKIQEVPAPEGGSNTKLFDVACFSTSCMAVGSYEKSGVRLPLIDRWNGSSWEVQSASAPAESTSTLLAGVSCPTAESCLAVGWYTKVGERPFVERWNGSSWSVETLPLPEEKTPTNLSAISCTSSTNCKAVGSYRQSFTTSTMVAEHWDGTKWTVQIPAMPTGGKSSSLVSIDCKGLSSLCVATGIYTNSAGKGTPLVERWNGTSWSQMSPALPGTLVSGAISDVYCFSGSECYVVGNYTNGEGIHQPLIDEWNGISWNIFTTPEAKEGALVGISCTSFTQCTAVGITHPSGGPETTLAERYQ